MAKKKMETAPVGEAVLDQYKIVNLEESVYPVHVYNDEGKEETLTLRLQGRGGQKPPVIKSTQITEHLRSLEKRGWLKLVKV